MALRSLTVFKCGDSRNAYKTIALPWMRLLGELHVIAEMKDDRLEIGQCLGHGQRPISNSCGLHYCDESWLQVTGEF
jgi:hypothetical protein